METVIKEKVKKKSPLPLWKKLVTALLTVSLLSVCAVCFFSYSYRYLVEVTQVDFSKGFESAVKDILGSYPEKEGQSLVLSEEIERLGLTDVHFPKEAFDEKYIITEVTIVDTSYAFHFRIKDSETIGFFRVFFSSGDSSIFENGVSEITAEVEQIEHLEVDGTDIVIWSHSDYDMLRSTYVYKNAMYDITYHIEDYKISLYEFREFMQNF